MTDDLLKRAPWARLRNAWRLARFWANATVGAALLLLGLFLIVVALVAATMGDVAGGAIVVRSTFGALLLGILCSILGILSARDAARLWRSSSVKS